MGDRYPENPGNNVTILTVIGNRPQFIKAAAVSAPLRAVAREVLVHTGQHYDEALSQIFFDELELPRPERGEHARRLLGVRAAVDPELDIGARDTQLAHEHHRQLVVVMLARVDEHLLRDLAQLR